MNCINDSVTSAAWKNVLKIEYSKIYTNILKEKYATGPGSGSMFDFEYSTLILV